MQKTKQTGRETTIIKDPGTIKLKIGRTTYELSLHFSNTSTENVQDKLRRIIINDCMSGQEILD